MDDFPRGDLADAKWHAGPPRDAAGASADGPPFLDTGSRSTRTPSASRGRVSSYVVLILMQIAWACCPLAGGCRSWPWRCSCRRGYWVRAPLCIGAFFPAGRRHHGGRLPSAGGLCASSVAGAASLARGVDGPAAEQCVSGGAGGARRLSRRDVADRESDRPDAVAAPPTTARNPMAADADDGAAVG